MTDIVDRLRSPRTEQGDMWPCPNLHEEAADEIERLRKENQKLRDALTSIQWKAQDTIRPVPFQEDEE